MRKKTANVTGNGGSGSTRGVRLPASGRAITINGYLVRAIGEPGVPAFYHVTRA